MVRGDAADLVVVGAGTIGGWASVFARESGAGRVVVIDRDLVGQGASSRAAGMVRAQGGSPDTVRLGKLVDRLLPISRPSGTAPTPGSSDAAT